VPLPLVEVEKGDLLWSWGLLEEAAERYSAAATAVARAGAGHEPRQVKHSEKKIAKNFPKRWIFKGGRLALRGPLRDARRFPSTRW
jgi:hypothetical protein